jgi:hypothetical protein
VRAGAAASPAPPPPAAPAASDDYLAWAAGAGIASPKVTQAYFGDLRGAKALQPVAAGEALITVPRAAALVVEPRGSRCPCPDFVAPSYWKEAPWYAKMAVLVLAERARGRASLVWGYIEQLPESIDTPVRWEAGEVAELQCPPLEREIAAQRAAWREQYSRFAGAAAGLGGGGVGWERWVWAAENVRSRAFSGPYAGAPLGERAAAAGAVAAAGLAYVAWAHVPLEQALNGAIAAAVFNLMYDVLLSSKLKWYAMCPVVDSINHSGSVESTIEFEYFQGAFAASVDRPYAAGEQVFISYGPQANDSLLQYYGFTEVANPNDTYTFAAQLEGGGGAVQLVVNAKGSFTPEALRAARGGADGPLPAAAEAALQRRLLEALEAELRGKPTSLADDERQLKAAYLMAPRARAAAAFRAEKKRLLQRAVQRAQKRAAKLEK